MSYFEQMITDMKSKQNSPCSCPSPSPSPAQTHRQDALEQEKYQDEQQTTVWDEPRIQLPYASKPVRLMASLYPLKHKLISEMLVRKNKYMQGHRQPEQAKPEEVKQNLPVLVAKGSLEDSRQSEKLLEQSEKLLAQSQSHSSYSQHPSTTSNNNNNNEIVLKLLKMLERDRRDNGQLLKTSVFLQQQSAQKNEFLHGSINSAQQQQQQQPQAQPIIINNVMRSPSHNQTATINKDLLERQIRIRMLEQNRSKPRSHNNRFCGVRPSQEANCETYRSSANDPHCTSLGGHNLYNFNTKALFEDSAQRQDQHVQAVSSGNKELCKESPPVQLRQYSEEIIEIKPEMTELTNQTEDFIKTVPDLEKVQSVQLIKRPVLIEIPINDHNNSTVSLAQAFKKRHAKLSSEKNPHENRIPTKASPSIVASARKQSRSTRVLSKELKGSSQVLSLAASKTTCIDLREDNTSIHNSSVNTRNKDPPKELLERLTYGSRAVVSKQEMYALTRKNYQKLPQVQAKRKQLEKRQQEAQRLEKIRQYQKMLRSLRPSTASKPIITVPLG